MATVLTCPALRCPLPAWNRSFPSADALLEHARLTRAFHPLCTTCFRVFKDTAALDQHVAAKHVVECQPCNRKYKSQSALDQHWRASSAHPNCPVCEVGAADTNALAVHIANAHPKVRCCGTLLNESDLDMHYLTSRNHPVCDRCNVGFPSEQEYTEHNSELHSELQCKICAEQFPSAEALKTHTGDLTSHRRCEFCSAQFKDTSALVEHFTESHLQVQEWGDSPTEVSAKTRSPSPMNQPLVHPSWGSISAVVGAERSSTDHPEPSSRASTSLSTSVSDIASELCRSSPSIGTFTPSPPGLDPSTGIFYPQNINRLPERPPQQEPPTSHFPNATYPTYVSGAGAGASSAVAYASSAVQTPPPVPLSPLSPSPPLPVPPRAARHVPVTPAHRGVHARSQSQSQLQSHQVVPQVPPSSARSKVSVAETPSGDLANFHLLKGSPLQSVADFDTPTPSPRTPSMPSVSPADAQAFALAAHGGSLPALTADRRFWPGSSVSPSVSRTHRVLRSSFYCRICRADPCHEITATACGHVFCNACIVEEVRENARCPVCNTAVLLFAMLKLDLS
ncbi:hypothetical protein BJV77DRAFT_99461 [Russula vinacea]|nr:hypothetical protein BJV77DRAFT_99461 [Russula vinacea]